LKYFHRPKTSFDDVEAESADGIVTSEIPVYGPAGIAPDSSRVCNPTLLNAEIAEWKPPLLLFALILGYKLFKFWVISRNFRQKIRQTTVRGTQSVLTHLGGYLWVNFCYKALTHSEGHLNLYLP
jgi:hypothetical protein